jgi:hypothetical protein
MKSRITTVSLFYAALSLLLLSIPAMQGCKHVRANTPSQTPKPIGDDEEDLEARKKAYIELIHRAAPGVDWRGIEEQNAINNYFRFHNGYAKTTASFAGGAINGTWHERGNDNIAGWRSI